MPRRRTINPVRPCSKCGGDIPPTRRSDARYCAEACRDAAEKARYCASHPEYVKRQRRQVREIKHLKQHGHTDFIDNPLLNPKDRYRVARSLGYRSMLEYNVAQQLISRGIEPRYETLKIHYTQPAGHIQSPDV